MTHNERVMRGRDEVDLSELNVLQVCRICCPEAEGSLTGRFDPIYLVSPSGTVHDSSGFGETDCGHDATGPGWWWAL